MKHVNVGTAAGSLLNLPGLELWHLFDEEVCKIARVMTQIKQRRLVSAFLDCPRAMRGVE